MFTTTDVRNYDQKSSGKPDICAEWNSLGFWMIPPGSFVVDDDEWKASCLGIGLTGARVPMFFQGSWCFGLRQYICQFHSNSWDAQLAVPNDPRCARLETNLETKQANEE
ncbi:hypothetical protein TNCV_2559911 [Trichonephila clavipes]|nr:hypothetical protein TNCV_2559911 [Trichonephila clavipes]